MAMRGRPLDEHTQRRIARLAGTLSVRKTARACEVSPTTVCKYKPRPRKPPENLGTNVRLTRGTPA